MLTRLKEFIPVDPDEADILTIRKGKYLNFISRLTVYPPGLWEDTFPTDKEKTIIDSIKKGLIPWFDSRNTLEEYVEDRKERNKKAEESEGFLKKKGPWSLYCYTNFFTLAPELILLPKEEILEKKEELEKPANVSGLPSDGTKGQVRAAKNLQLHTAKWFLGEWDGHHTEWKDNIENNSDS